MASRTKSEQLCIVIPAYNEAGVVGAVLDGLPRRIKIGGRTLLVTVVVINDGSKDNTAETVSKRNNVKLINHLINSGAGAATRTGMVYAAQNKFDYVITMDADGQHHVDDVIKVAKEISKNEYDLIIGSRLIESAGMPGHRIIGNKGLSFITFLLFGVFVTDSQSGLKAIKGSCVDKILFNSNNYAFCSEMLWRARKARLKIKEIPVQALYTEYSLGKGQSNWGALSILTQLIKHRIEGLING